MVDEKDFKAVAEIIEDNPYGWDGKPDPIAQVIANKLTDYFATQNPRFDRNRFMQACGLTK